MAEFKNPDPLVKYHFQPGVVQRYRCKFGKETWGPDNQFGIGVNSHRLGSQAERHKHLYRYGMERGPQYWTPMGWVALSGDAWNTRENLVRFYQANKRFGTQWSAVRYQLQTNQPNAVLEAQRRCEHPFYYISMSDAWPAPGASVRLIGDLRDADNYKFAEYLMPFDFTDPYQHALLRLGSRIEGEDKLYSSYEAQQNQGFGLCIKADAFYLFHRNNPNHFQITIPNLLMGYEEPSASIRHGLGIGSTEAKVDTLLGIVEHAEGEYDQSGFGNLHYFREHDHPHVPILNQTTEDEDGQIIEPDYTGKPKCFWFDPPKQWYYDEATDQLWEQQIPADQPYMRPTYSLGGLGSRRGNISAYWRGGVLGDSILRLDHNFVNVGAGALEARNTFGGFNVIAIWTSIERYNETDDTGWGSIAWEQDACAFVQGHSEGKKHFFKGKIRWGGFNSGLHRGHEVVVLESEEVPPLEDWGMKPRLSMTPLHEWQKQEKHEEKEEEEE